MLKLILLLLLCVLAYQLYRAVRKPARRDHHKDASVQSRRAVEAEFETTDTDDSAG